MPCRCQTVITPNPHDLFLSHFRNPPPKKAVHKKNKALPLAKRLSKDFWHQPTQNGTGGGRRRAGITGSACTPRAVFSVKLWKWPAVTVAQQGKHRATLGSPTKQCMCMSDTRSRVLGHYDVATAPFCSKLHGVVLPEGSVLKGRLRC